MPVTKLDFSMRKMNSEVHLFFIGDPALPGDEVQMDGKLHLHRWCQSGVKSRYLITAKNALPSVGLLSRLGQLTPGMDPAFDNAADSRSHREPL